MTERELIPEMIDAGRGLIRAAARSEWRGPDPYDGLFYAWPAGLCAGRRRRQAIVQAHARSPVDVRRLYRRHEHPRIAKALGLFGQASLSFDSANPDRETRADGLDALSLLLEDRTSGDAWGYPFDVQTRWSFYPAGSANVVVTSFAATALSDGGLRLSDERFKERARRAARWTLEHAFNERTGAFSYHEHSDTVIHNANLLAAKLVWAELGAEPAARAAVSRAVERSLAEQRADGTWRYGEGTGLEWNDSFHTGFVLSSLVALRDVDSAVWNALVDGAPNYAERFFGANGEARLWPERPFPEDAHAAGTGLSTLASLSDVGLADASLLASVGARVLSKTIRGNHAVWRRGRWSVNRIPYIRWCDAHVALGLADAARVLETQGNTSGSV